MPATAARILLLHGFLATSRGWRPVVDALGDTVAVATPDLAGHGRARRVHPASLDQIVDHLIPFVEHDQPTHVVGHSMGGVVALALAARLPGRFEGVGLISLPVFESTVEGRAYIAQRGRFHRAAIGRHALSHTGCAALHILRPAWAPVVPRLVRAVHPARVPACFDHTYEAHRAILDSVVFAGHVPALAAKVDVPVAVLHSPNDASAPVAAVEALAGLHSWDLTLLPDGGHQLPIAHAARTATWLRESLLRQP
ncbi:MAG TPA: alpha/beta hydrolase [Tepidiformaceae bacterium]|nr:alpha/beta hydrolase [Tepidiformaceae bacterium]